MRRGSGPGLTLLTPPSGVPTALMCLLGALDFFFVSHAYHSILTRGASVQLVFGFEVKWAWEAGKGLRAVPVP